MMNQRSIRDYLDGVKSIDIFGNTTPPRRFRGAITPAQDVVAFWGDAELLLQDFITAHERAIEHGRREIEKSQEELVSQ